MSLPQFLFLLIVGTMAGALDGLMMKRRRVKLVLSILVGIVGAVVGAYLLRQIGLAATNALGQLLVALLGAALLLWPLRLIK